VVPHIDLTRRHLRYRAALLAAVDRVLGSGRVLLGAELEALENDLAEALQVEHVVGVASGASAIQLALTAAGVGPGDEVIVPAFTAVPTASAVCAAGATPVPVDVDPLTACLDPEAAGAALTDRTKAIIPVHLYGRPVDPAPFVQLGLAVIEDAAQAQGALHGVGGVAAALSFYPTKNLGGIGDGGAVATNDGALAAEVRLRRQHGLTDDYAHVAISQNFRMSELEAAWLRSQLPDLASDDDRRRTIARRYRAAAPSLEWQADDERHVYHLCVAKVPDRASFRDRLSDAGVGTGVHYPLSLGAQPAYAAFARQPTPHADDWAARCVSLPCFPELTDDEVDTVAAVLQSVQA
jgi:dTDP-3-amino-3,4,6-trideoxy-alpha-D-glucose transaminase